MGVDVRPHPHIGLATVTCLFEGGIYHRDSLGSSGEIKPGAVNWMVAGRGITHSERSAPERRRAGERLYGIQTWVALPDAEEESAPSFEQAPPEALPVIEGEGKEVRLILGTLFGERAPVTVFSEMFYASARLDAGARLRMPRDHEERGIYLLEGELELGGERYEAGQMMVLKPGDDVVLRAERASHVMLLGGTGFEKPRYIWWNFVASDKEKLEAAKRAWAEGDWASGRFQLPPDDSDEFIPLPG